MPNPTIPAFLQNPQITGIVRSNDVPVNYLGNRWFPSEPVTADEFDGLVMLDQVDLAPFVAVDAETPLAPEDIIGQYKWEVAYIRQKKRFKESDLRVFFEPGVTDSNTMAAANATAAEAKIRRGVDALSLYVEARKEWMFASAIAGAIAYDDAHVQYSVTYNGAYIGATNRKTPTTAWSAASPTPVTDLSNWIEEVSDESGVDDWVLVLPPAILGDLARSEQIRQLWTNTARSPAPAEPDSLNPVVTNQVAGALTLLGISQVIKYTSKYTTRTESAGSVTRTKVRFIDDRDIFLLPANEQLGRMATAPAKPNNYQPGKFGWSKEMEDPWVVEVGAGEYTWIDFPPTRHNHVLQARVR